MGPSVLADAIAVVTSSSNSKNHLEVFLNPTKTQGRYDDAQMFDTNVFNGEEVFVAEQSEKVVEEVVSNAEVSAAATITTEEITLTQALAELRSAKPKDKGKAKMIEPEKPLKKKEQIRLDEELAFKLQAEEEQAKLAR
ncbi:hypothetical protein Tco_1420993 [Tanacetum coccineum]